MHVHKAEESIMPKIRAEMRDAGASLCFFDSLEFLDDFRGGMDAVFMDIAMPQC